MAYPYPAHINTWPALIKHTQALLDDLQLRGNQPKRIRLYIARQLGSPPQAVIAPLIQTFNERRIGYLIGLHIGDTTELRIEA